MSKIKPNTEKYEGLMEVVRQFAGLIQGSAHKRARLFTRRRVMGTLSSNPGSELSAREGLLNAEIENQIRMEEAFIQEEIDKFIDLIASDPNWEYYVDDGGCSCGGEDCCRG